MVTNIAQTEMDFNPVETKVCTKCKQDLPVTQFYARKYGFSGDCRKCHKEINARNYQAKIEERRAKNRAYGAEHKAEQAARGKKFYEANRESELEKAHERYIANPEPAIQRSKEWLINNRERHYANTRRRAAAKPDVAKAERTAISHTSRAKKWGVVGKWTGQEWLAHKAKYGNKCLCCGKTEPEVILTPDMVVPFSRGGSNTLDNIQVLCLPCNDLKARKIIDYRPENQ